MADDDTKLKDEEVSAPADDPKEEPKDAQPSEPEPEVPEETEAPEEVEEESPAEEPKPSRRESLRIQQLLEKLKEQPKTEAPEPKIGIDYNTTLDADPEVVKQLEADRKAVAEAQYSEGLKQAQSIQFRTMLEIDAPKVESKYPQLDKESSQFNPAVANAINQWYLNMAGFDPTSGSVQNANIRYAEFVEGVMELADEMAGEKAASSTKNIAKQAASTGLRPDGSRTKGLDLNKAPDKMTYEELKAVLAQAGL